MNKNKVTGIVLAGGFSSRFGSNKALVRIGSKKLIEHVLSRLEPLFDEIIIVTNDPLDYVDLEKTIVTDIIPHQGPLGGIYTGLFFSRHDYALVMACDMPFVNQEFVNYLVEKASGYDVVVPCFEDKFEPLHAVYSKRCLNHMKRLLEQNKRQVVKIFKRVKTLKVGEDIIRRFDPDMKCFFNINTITDWEKALEDYNLEKKNSEERPLHS